VGWIYSSPLLQQYAFYFPLNFLYTGLVSPPALGPHPPKGYLKKKRFISGGEGSALGPPHFSQRIPQLKEVLEVCEKKSEVKK
jgi:hypothetical protein